MYEQKPVTWLHIYQWICCQQRGYKWNTLSWPANTFDAELAPSATVAEARRLFNIDFSDWDWWCVFWEAPDRKLREDETIRSAAEYLAEYGRQFEFKHREQMTADQWHTESRGIISRDIETRNGQPVDQMTLLSEVEPRKLI